MVRIFTELSKYIIVIIMLIYTFECFFVFKYKNEHERKIVYLVQKLLMIIFQAVSCIVLFLKNKEVKFLLLFFLITIIELFVFIAYEKLYPKANKLIINNMCLLLSIGFIILGRLSYGKALRQLGIAAVAIALSMVIPMILSRYSNFERFTAIYIVLGLVMLISVLLFSKVVNGSKINISIAGMTFQPSEIVKIIFIFAIAGILYRSVSFKQILISAIIAAAHVLILVLSKDLGSAVIFFSVYFAMLYVASGKYFYYLSGYAIGIISAIAGYFMFSHVRVRVAAFINPLQDVDNAGYQIAQSLFAIGTGGYFGMGLYQGVPNKIPVVLADFIYSAISEEFGLIFAICLTLICVSCFIMFMNIAMLLENKFYKYIAVGLSVNYGFQVLLTLGGVTKFIPMTGVTLPLISYGGTSVMVTIIMFSIIQGLYIVQGNSAYRRINKNTKEINRTSGIPSMEKTGDKRRANSIPKKYPVDNSQISKNRIKPDLDRLSDEESDLYRVIMKNIQDDDFEDMVILDARNNLSNDEDDIEIEYIDD